MPGTSIDDPILMNPEGDNNYYLIQDLQGNPNKNGAFCADFRCTLTPGTRRTLSRNTALYGHNWTEDPNGELFDQLKKYKDPTFARNNPYVFFSTEAEDMAWEVFAVYDTHYDFPYILPDLPRAAFEKVLEGSRNASIYNYDVEVGENDKILTLSTCTFDIPGVGKLPLDEVNPYRFVVMARLAAPDERAKKTASITVNDDMLTADELPVILNPDMSIFQLDGLLVYRFEQVNFNIDVLADPAKAVRIGEIAKTGVLTDIKDWESTDLPVGTAIYRDPEYADILFAEVDGTKQTYIVGREQYETEKITAVLEGPQGERREKVYLKDDGYGPLGPYIDMMYFQPLPDGEDAIQKSGGGTSIRILTKDSITTYEQLYFRGIPASLGREVLVIHQQDGWYYTDAATYDELAALLK